MSFQERQKIKNHSDQQGNHLKASVHYLVHSRLSGLQPGGVVVVTSSFSDSIVFAVHTRKTAFSNSTVFKSFHFGERFRNQIIVGLRFYILRFFYSQIFILRFFHSQIFSFSDFHSQIFILSFFNLRISKLQ